VQEVTYYKSSVADLDPGSGDFLTLDPDPGSGIGFFLDPRSGIPDSRSKTDIFRVY
jgi:hypothetical protein